MKWIFPDAWRAKLLSKPSTLFARFRRQIDTWMHHPRHRWAKWRVRRFGRPDTILVLCHGNICRSPYMAAVLQQLLPDVEVTSAGFVAPGQSVPEHGRTLAARRGLDLSSHRSRLLTREMIADAGLVVAMEPRQAAYVTRELMRSAKRVVVAGDLDPMSGNSRAIRDPLRQSIEVFEDSYRRLDRCAAVIADSLSAPKNTTQSN